MPKHLLLVMALSPTVDYTDAAEVYVDIQALVTVEAPVIYFDIQPSTAVELFGSLDAATVLVDISNTGGECFSTATALDLGEGEANREWYEEAYVCEWSTTEETEWTYGDTTAEAVC